VHKAKDGREGITDLKYCPPAPACAADGRLLAAATADTWIDIYNAAKGYQRVQRCSGHRQGGGRAAVTGRAGAGVGAGREGVGQPVNLQQSMPLSLLPKLSRGRRPPNNPKPPISSTVRGIDWSSDGSMLQSDSADLELLVWNARTGAELRSIPC
jgi:WD40 repeat protein